MGDVHGDPLLGADPARFPNTRLRSPAVAADGPSPLPSASRSRPVPESSPSAAPADPDTCRICRGEGTPEEPLFYPCKCSGSIKYVHQDCLMEWLSHSQKKHCELCKTPFRFTKLYAPNMPKDLPFHIFVSHTAKYTVRNIMVWLRAALVTSVWLGWLPYLMRSVWSFLFWISDEGLGGGPSLWRPNVTLSTGSGSSSSAAPFGSTVCPSSPLFAATTTVAAAGGVAVESLKTARGLEAFNFSGAHPVYSTFLQLFFGTTGSSEKTYSNTPASHAFVEKVVSSAKRHPSLLSEVSFLKNLTRHPSINRTVIAILEGQIITVLVIVCFILIILVRDYVVQQQPEINMRAAFAAENAAQPRAAVPAILEEPIPHLAGPDDDDPDDIAAMEVMEPFEIDDSDDGFPHIIGTDSEDNGEDEDDRLWARDRAQQPETGGRSDQHLGLNPSGATIEREDESAIEPGHDASPLHMPLSQGSEQSPEVDNPATGPDRNPADLTHLGGATVQEYLRLYREAGGDPEKILLLAKEQQLEEKLDYWMKLTKSLKDRDRRRDTDGHAERGESSNAQQTTPSRVEPSTAENTQRVRQAHAAPDSKGSDKWESSGETEAEGKERAQALGPVYGNGKGKAILETKLEVDVGESSDSSPATPPPTAGALRPRSNTDGPKIYGAIHPLANNNWSFAELPSEPLTASTSASFGEPLSRSQVADGDADTPDESEVGFPTPPSSTLAETGSPPTRGASPAVPEDVHDAQETPAPMPVPGIDSAQATQPDIPDFDFNTVRQPGEGDGEGEGEARRDQPAGLVGRVADFMWREVDAIDPAELLPAADPLDEFDDHEEQGPVGLARDDAAIGDMGRDPEAAEAADAAVLDAEAIDDAEDLEGIMELLGMRGPIAGLFQNAIFCAFLVSITIFLGIFVPYNIGRLTVWTIVNPMWVVRLLVGISKFLQDCFLVVLGVCSCALSYLVRIITKTLGTSLGNAQVLSMIAWSWQMAKNAAVRIAESFTSDVPILSRSEMRNFSALSHEALLLIKDYISSAMSILGRGFAFVLSGDYSAKSADFMILAANITAATWAGVKDMPALLSAPGAWVINFNLPDASTSVDPDLAYWNGTDRFWAIACGYMALSVLAALYLRRGVPFSSSQTGQEWEASIIDGLNQASGVMKVILIIGIEMLIFPLYCGLLLDAALLPLFESTTMVSRVAFMGNYPLTSVFVHWFVGTGYMFHFALFVSMCRKIMRKGVLYFIRDPDDPEFHPVRDVLERNVMTQLRKILFSALVYGALVIVCLGGVVWGLSCTLPSVFPIHYSSNEPVLEFPIDLLFYNFLMPLAVKFFRPSDGLHAMYTWWFRKCARGLRITWFLFGERRVDEEGVLRLRPESPYCNASWWRTLLLELDTENYEVVPKTWRDTFEGGKAKPTASIGTDDMIRLNVQKIALVKSGQLVPDGRFVRSPASDQVKIPKGRRVFLDVTEANTRRDGRAEGTNPDLYSTDQYLFVYVPPHFRFRIFLFILFIWAFAALTGVGITIVPLVFGRYVFKMLIPAQIRTNDIYAFSIGIYVLGSAMYTAVHIRSIYAKVQKWAVATCRNATNHDVFRRVAHATWRAIKFVYAYFFLLVVFPLLVASLMELYALIPLHTYLYSVLLSGEEASVDGALSASFLEGNPKHNIRVIQAWTIGLLYLKLSARFVTKWFSGTRLATAVRAVLRRGWMDPDVVILTRAFVVPGLTLWALAVVTPLLIARFMVAHGLTDAILASSGTVLVDEATAAPLRGAYLVLIYRLSFPIMAVAVAAGVTIWSLIGVFRTWKVRIRDEAYLIGERLHNFGVGTGQSLSKARGALRGTPINV